MAVPSEQQQTTARVAEWLELGAADLDRLAEVSAPAHQRLIEVAALCNLVAEVFDGDLSSLRGP